MSSNALNIHQPSLSVNSMWSQIPCWNFFRWCLVEKNPQFWKEIILSAHVSMYVCNACMYTCKSLPNPQNNKSQIYLGLGRNPKSRCYLKQKLVRINCVTEGRYTHFNPFQHIHLSAWWRCYLNETKKVGMNLLHVSISTKLRCYLQHISIRSSFFKSNKI